MKLEPVSSSNIKEVGYEPSTKTLFVKFHSGHTYRYSNVSQEKYEAFKNADSLRGHLHNHIKPKHDCERCR